MDPYTRLEIIKEFAWEIVTEKDLLTLFETMETPIAYDGFEPSGPAHIPFAIYRTLLTGYLLRAGFHVKYLLADSFAWINHKLGGDIDKIRETARYYIEVWRKAGEVLGVPFEKVEIVWHKDLFDDPEYWRKVLLVAKSHTLARTRRALTIAGRVAGERQEVAIYFYPSMQAADVFHLPVDTPQMGIDQRKVNMLVRDVAWKNIDIGGKRERLYKVVGYDRGVEGKPVPIHHRLLPSLLPPPTQLPGYDEDMRLDFLIATKMSKSRPETTITVHDTRSKIRKKIRKAFCPPKSVIEHTVYRERDGKREEMTIRLENPVLVYIKEIVFRTRGEITVKTRNGENKYTSFADLVRDYDEGLIHPLDLKNALAEELDRLIAPIREYFEKGPGRKLYEAIVSAQITR